MSVISDFVCLCMGWSNSSLILHMQSIIRLLYTSGITGAVVCECENFKPIPGTEKVIDGIDEMCIRDSYTCSAENMDADELIVFLKQKGKFMPVENGFTVDITKVCNH